MADNNPKNNASPLIRRLTRLFSGPIVNFRQQQQRRFKRRSLDNYASRFTSASGKQFQKTTYNPFETLGSAYMSNQNRGERYKDFDQMEYTPEIASALDIYADEMTTSNQLQPLLNIECPNEEIKIVLHTLYYNILNIEFNLFGWCRTMCKFGDFFLYIDLDENVGVKHAMGLPPHEIERMEGQDPSNPNYVQFQWNSAGMTFENWQISHFRILGHDKYAPYGSSVLEAARRIWRQLQLMEDAMMSYRIVRSPERRVFYVDVGNIAPQDVEQYMLKIMGGMKRNQVVDPTTGRVDLRYNPMSVDEDYFLPVRGAGSGTRIESLPGGQFTGDIDDVQYLRDKLFSALKIPQSYLSRGEGGDEDKTTLAQKDIRFARTIQRLQRAMLAELEKIGIIHLYTLGFRSEDLVNFKLTLNNPSQIAELQQLENLRTKFDVAAGATEGYFSRRWIAKNIFNMSDEEFLRMQREMFYDRQLDAELGAFEMEGDAGLGGLGGDFGGDFGEAEEDLDAELGDIADAGEDFGGGEDPSSLLTAPANREMTTTPKSHGWYKPVTSDSRGMGARKRSYHGLYSRETGKNTTRNVFKGFSDLRSLSRGIYENKDTNYGLDEEKKLFEVSYEVKKLIADLESKTNEK